MSAKESLDSNRVNYLVWRYLIDQGYKETAVHLQKEWDQEDPRALPFAQVTPEHGLVKLLNKGLMFDALERDFEREENNKSLPGFFENLTVKDAPSNPPPAPVVEEVPSQENVRKHQIDDDAHPIQNGTTKRPRLSNGFDHGYDVGAKSPTAMDVDEEPQNGDGNAYPSPEQLPSPVVATFGPEVGVQADKVDDLTPRTTFIDLFEDAASSSRSMGNAVLLHCEFNPRDPMLLAAAGTDALARLWTISRTPPGSDVLMQNGSPRPTYINLLHKDLPNNTMTTCLAWTSDGNSIATATEGIIDDTARIQVMTLDAHVAVSLDSFCASVVLLRWNMNDTLLLAISPEANGAGTIISIIAVHNKALCHLSLPNHEIEKQALDVTWISDDEFVICGGDLLQVYQYADGKITLGRKYETREDPVLSKVAFDVHTRLLATASDTGIVDIWDQQGLVRSFNAHQGPVTTLTWQSRSTSTPLSDSDERLLASAGDDGAISIWNARSAETKSKCSMTMDLGVVAMAFTPDGAFIAGATHDRVLIWKVGESNVPRACWIRGAEQGWQTPKSTESELVEDQHSLSWDANGQRLAYGVNSLLAMIDFR